jgi:hypothetical protein
MDLASQGAGFGVSSARFNPQIGVLSPDPPTLQPQLTIDEPWVSKLQRRS